jgi:hypothetical protein
MKKGWGLLVLLPLLCACAARREAAIVWTDRPEIAVYAEYFNAGHDEKVEVRYFENPVQRLMDRGKNTGGTGSGPDERGPDILVASWLKSASSRVLFRPLQNYFRDGSLRADRFYRRLLSLGRIEEKQYLLPVSFNIPAIVFARENAGLLSGLLTVEPEEIRWLGKDFNTFSTTGGNGGIYTRMGFSPAWNSEFLFLTASLFGTAFRETGALTWNGDALEEAILYIRDWIQDANTSTAAEDDFSFKYFFVPPVKLVQSGRILFTCLGSAEFFVLGEELRNSLDFRWLSGPRSENGGSIPLEENSTWYGVCRGGKAAASTEAFTRWLFDSETQRFLLEESKRLRMNESTFGIAQGFSALRAVTEHIFPQFYPGLLGHIPPEESLEPPDILPSNWLALKRRVILPFLREQARSPSPPQIYALEQQITTWIRLNQE